MLFKSVLKSDILGVGQVAQYRLQLSAKFRTSSNSQSWDKF